MIKDRAKRILNLEDFRNAGGPEKIARLDLTPPTAEQYILRMAIRANSSIILPSMLQWVQPMLSLATLHQTVIGADHPFIYVTVRHGIVKSTKDDEWHVDGFSTRVPHVPEQNYIWANVNPTEYAVTNASFPPEFNPRLHNVNHYLEAHVGEVQTALASTVYCMDPYVLHRRPASTSGTLRTFVRISFVPIEINDINNTQNPFLHRTYTDNGLEFRSQLTTF